MSALIKLCWLLAVSVLWGCNVTANEKQTPPAAPDYRAALRWVNTANAEQDVRSALQKGDYQLLVFGGRGEQLPGVSAADSARLRQRCGLRYLSGSTDVIRDQAHLQLLLQANRYARDYNQLMLAHCEHRP
ncbi:MAG: hypothetical protein KTR20_11175 [Cellvibrionaceae bacterium]|nr:hypothetical protein [Cellvibrionaceae bacterium]